MVAALPHLGFPLNDAPATSDTDLYDQRNTQQTSPDYSHVRRLRHSQT